MWVCGSLCVSPSHSSFLNTLSPFPFPSSKALLKLAQTLLSKWKDQKSHTLKIFVPTSHLTISFVAFNFIPKPTILWACFVSIVRSICVYILYRVNACKWLYIHADIVLVSSKPLCVCAIFKQIIRDCEFQKGWTKNISLTMKRNSMIKAEKNALKPNRRNVTLEMANVTIILYSTNLTLSITHTRARARFHTHLTHQPQFGFLPLLFYISECTFKYLNAF